MSQSQIKTLRKNNWLWQALKWLIFAGNIWYLYIMLGKDDAFHQVFAEVNHAFDVRQSAGFKIILLAGFLLLFINWGFEALKWKILIQKFQKISFSRCFAAIFAGAAISLWIPNRVGEYLGRILFIRSGLRVKGILATFIGSFAQLSITLLLGICGALFYAYERWPQNIFWSIVPVLSIVFAALLLFFYFNINKVRFLLPKKSKLRKFRKYFLVYKFYNFNDLAKVLFFSLLRYIIFSGQFILFLWFFDGAFPAIGAWFAIFLVYLVQTAVPTTALTELGVRGAASVYFLENYVNNAATILSASYSLWLINLLLPSAIGLLFLLLYTPAKNVQET